MNGVKAAATRISGRTARFLLAAIILCAVSACAGGDWPKLADVQRPRESETYAAPVPPPAETTAAEAPAPPPAEAIVPITAQALAGAKARLDAALAGLGQADAAYAAALRTFLTISEEGEVLEESWAMAQYQLTRLGAAIDAVDALEGELASLGLGTGPDTPPELTLALAREIERAGSALDGRDRGLLIENNRLAVLTPERAGLPGPNAITPGERPAFVRVNLADPKAAFAAPLAAPINRALEVAGDLRFDVVAAGADRTQAQTNLRRVTAALLNLGIPRDQLVIALEPDEAGAPQVAIYLRAKSA